MIKSERIAKNINKKIAEWQEGHQKLIVAIDGYAGSGKTTVADFIAKQNENALVVHLDELIKHWKERKRMIEKAVDKSKVFEYEWYRYSELEKLAKAFKNKNSGVAKAKLYDFNKNVFFKPKAFDLSKTILIVEGIFLLHSRHKINKLWDKRIYLDVDFNKADKQRIIREKKNLGKKYLGEDHPDNWVSHYKTAYKRYVKEEKPQKNCDVVFNV